MRQLSYILISLFILATLSFLLTSCNIKEPTAPNWDVALNLPIAKKSYTLYDIIEKKTNSMQHYTQGTDKDLIFYTQTTQFKNIDMSGKINIEPFSATKSQNINDIIVKSETMNSDIGFAWINPAIAAGLALPIPVINNVTITTHLAGVNQFQYIKMKSGFIDFTFSNHFPSPVNITINGFVLKDSISGSTIIQSSDPIVLAPQQTSTVQSFPIISGVTINNQFSLQFTVSTNGSSGQKIIIPDKSISITATARDLRVTEANAIIPKQNPIQVDGSVFVDQNSSQPSQFQTAKLDGGVMNAVVSNNLNVNIDVTFVMDNLITPQGSAFSYVATIPAKSTINVIQNISIAGYSIISPDGTPTNKITYHVYANVIPTNDYRFITSTDNVSATVDIKNLSVSEFKGRLKPTVVDPKRSAISLNLKDVQNKLQFAQIDLKNPKIELHLHPTSSISFSVNGRIEARNSRGEKSSMSLSSRTMNKTIISPTDSVITLNGDSVSNFFRSFTKFPDSLIVFAGGIANPNYEIIDIKKTDQVVGKSIMEIPFELGLTGGVYTDSVKVDLSSDDRNRINDVNTLSANLLITNGIAAGVNFTGKLYDRFNNFLMYFPPKHQDQDTILSVSSATTGSDGNVTSPNTQSVNVKLAQGESAKIQNAAYMRVRLAFGTPGTQRVKFKTNDVINIVASGSTNYHVNTK
jgi:hypothetical protein